MPVPQSVPAKPDEHTVDATNGAVTTTSQAAPASTTVVSASPGGRGCQGSSGGFARLVRSLCWRPSAAEREKAAELEDAASTEQTRERCDQRVRRGRCLRGRAEREPEVVGSAGELVQELAWECDDGGGDLWGCAEAVQEPTEAVSHAVLQERGPEDLATPVLSAGGHAASPSTCLSAKLESPVKPLKLLRATLVGKDSPMTGATPMIGETPPTSMRGASPGRYIDDCDSRPIADLLLQVAQERDFQTVRVGTMNKRLLDLLLEAFGLLGISTAEELEEQLLSDSRNHEHAWIGTRDAIVTMVKTTLLEVGAQQEEIAPVLAACSNLLSKALRRFSMQKGSSDHGSPSVPAFAGRGIHPRLEGLPSRGGAPVCCVGGDAFNLMAACEAVDPFKDDDEDQPDLEEAIRTIDRVASEVSKIMAEARSAPRHEVSALLQRKWVLENLPEYIRAKRILDDGVPARHGESPKPTIIRVRREDQVLLRL